MMVVEITAGTFYGSMALVADGWHMSTHAAALLVAALSYGYARRNAENPRFTFGTGKIGDLAGFASAVVLASRDGVNPRFEGVEQALSVPGVDVRIFGKPTTRPYRRMAVALAKGPNALARARAAAAKISVHVST